VNYKPPKLYFDTDADISVIQSKKIGVIGFGNQGRPQALNLRDSGCEVRIGARETCKSWGQAIDDGFAIGTINEVSGWADVLVLLLPDQIMAEVFNSQIKPALKKGSAILFAHGYNIHYGYIKPPPFIDIIMVAPSGAGKLVRDCFLKGSGVPNLIAVHQDISQSAMELALAYSKAIGGTRVGAFLSSFQEEVESDLFGEQVVLTGGVPQLVRAAFETLVNDGFQPVVAWFVCYYELKMIVDLFHDKGFAFLNNAISDTAEYGGYTRGKRLIGPSVKLGMQNILKEIKSGDFAREWQQEKEHHFTELNRLRSKERNESIETVTDFMLGQLYKSNQAKSKEKK